MYAIAITLLVLDIAVPAHEDQHLLSSLGHLWPSYLAYVVSFSTIGASWLGHNAITEYLDRVNATFIRLNLLLLLLIAFLPFPTRLFADYIGQDRPERIAATIYGISLLLSSTLLWALWRYAVHAGLVRPDAADEEVQFLTRRLTPGLGGYLVLIVAGLFLPVIAVLGYLAIALYYIVPFRRPGRIHLPRGRGQPGALTRPPRRATDRATGPQRTDRLRPRPGSWSGSWRPTPG